MFDLDRKLIRFGLEMLDESFFLDFIRFNVIISLEFSIELRILKSHILIPNLHIY